MYSDAQLNAAVSAGAISPQSANALRAFVARQQAAPNADEEHFRLLTGFNDIFVTIAIALVLVALTWITGLVGRAAAGAACAAASWALAEYFTRRRRMALPSILLLLSFVGGVAVLAAFILFPPHLLAPIGPPVAGSHADWRQEAKIALVAVLAALAAWAHWRRFKVPITVAAGSVAGWVAFMALILPLSPHVSGLEPGLWFAGGLVLFARAMAWDMSDPARVTRMSDVAFWLHLAAAPMLVHPVFSSITERVLGGGQVVAAALTVLLYLGIAVVALAVDRRALLVSALAYVLWALVTLLRDAGGGGLTAPGAALVIGSLLLLLSVFWQRARRTIVGAFPVPWRLRLPAI